MPLRRYHPIKMTGVLGNKITIYLPIQYTGAGATAGITDLFDRGIERWWSGQFGKYQVITKVVHGPFYKNDKWNIVHIPNCSGRQNAQIGGWYGTWHNKRWDDPTGDPRLLGWTAAHEAGHLMGLIDRYKDGKDGVSIVNQGYYGNIMAHAFGHAWGADINAILKYQYNTVIHYKDLPPKRISGGGVGGRGGKVWSRSQGSW